MMLRAGVQTFIAAAACLGMAGCATSPDGERAKVTDFPLASAHADIGFMMTTGVRQSVACEEAACATEADRAGGMRFAEQVQRVSRALQHGARNLYPDLAQRAPGLADGRFDVYVVEHDEPGSASSANGRIALNAALGAGAPYDDWLAFVIAREMGHVIARHHEENSTASIATSVILNLIIPGSSLLKALISAGGSGFAARSKREVQALEADAIALSLLKASGFRLHDVSLALLVAPALPDEGSWSKDFRESCGNFHAEARRSEFAVAAVTAGTQAWHEPALDPNQVTQAD